MWTGAFDGLYQAIPIAHPACVGVDIGEAAELINEMHVGHPIIREAAQVRDDEIQVRIFSKCECQYYQVYFYQSHFLDVYVRVFWSMDKFRKWHEMLSNAEHVYLLERTLI